MQKKILAWACFLYSLWRRTEFCDTDKYRPASTDGLQLCAARLSCYVALCIPNSFRGSHVFPQFGDGEEIFQSKDSKILPFIHDRDSHWQYRAVDLEGVEGSCKSCKPSPLAIMVSPYILYNLEKKRFFLLCKWYHEFAPREQSHHLLHGRGAVNNGDEMGNGTQSRTNGLYAVLLFITYLNLDHIVAAIINNCLHKT